MVFTKLAAICNTCFWLALGFQFLEFVRNMPRQILNTIVVLGMISIVINAAWLLLIAFRKNQNTGITNAPPHAPSAQLSSKWIAGFIIVSFLAQVIFLLSEYL